MTTRANTKAIQQDGAPAMSIHCSLTTAAPPAAAYALCDTLSAVFGWSDDGEVQFFHRHDIEYDEEGYPSVDARWADSPARPDERVPLLGLKWGGEGVWLDDASEWLTHGDELPPDNGEVAYTPEGVRLLIELVRPGDMLIPLGPCVLQPKI